MSKDELINYLKEYLEKIAKSRQTMLQGVLGNSIILEQQLKDTKDNIDRLADVNLNILSEVLDVDADIIHKLEKYQCFVITSYFKLNEEQQNDLEKLISLLLNKVLEKNDKKLILYPEIASLDDEESLIRDLLNRMSMTSNDITLKEYSDIVKILRRQNSLYAKDLLRELSFYMNQVVLNEKRSKYQNTR